MAPALTLALPSADPETVERLSGRIAQLELTPEHLFDDPAGVERLVALGRRLGCGFVAQGSGLSLGTAWREDATRRQLWLDGVARLHRRLEFRWYAEPLGACVLAGLALGIPVPLPSTAQTARVVRGRLRAMRRVVPVVAVRNAARDFCLGDPLEEARWIGRVLGPRHMHLVLDLGALELDGRRLGLDVEAYLAALELERVLALRVSDGAAGEDGTVFEAALARARALVPRCPRLQSLVLAPPDALPPARLSAAAETLAAA
jgi:hypothetical protein